MIYRIIGIGLFLVVNTVLRAQVVNTATADTSSGEHIGKLTISGYLDTYYGNNFNLSESNIPPLVSCARNNEFSVNLAYIDLRYQDKNFRARIMPGFGSYMNANYAAEPTGLNNFVEAHAGFKLFSKKDIWIDAGIFGSPYTNESAISKDHLMYTRSLAPEYVPYYLAGAKVSIPLSKKINFYFYALNGWQQIADINPQKSIGTQVEISVDDKNLLNWNTYYGNERSELNPNFRFRYFTDVYWIHTSKKIAITSCAYFGIQEKEVNSSYEMKNWWQANFILKYKFSDKYSLSARVEYFSDAENTMISVMNNQQGFNCFGSGLCFNYHFSNEGMFRLEARNFLTKELNYRTADGQNANYMNWIVSNITIWF